MSYDENRISDQIEGGLLHKEEQDKEMFERLVNNHFSLFRRLNQINNKEGQSEATQKALAEAAKLIAKAEGERKANELRNQTLTPLFNSTRNDC